jgi:hypothetical protein
MVKILDGARSLYDLQGIIEFLKHESMSDFVIWISQIFLGYVVTDSTGFM